jgi:RNA polymerase sigma factor for flagellar operon FliA
MVPAHCRQQDPVTDVAPSRDELIARYLPEVKRIVSRVICHLPPGVDKEDLLHAGVIGLIQAIERFDPARNNKFITYATFRIKGAVLSELRSRDFLGRSVRKKLRHMEKASGRLEVKLGRRASSEELASEMGLKLDQLDEIKKMSCISFISFEEIGIHSVEDQEDLVSRLTNGDIEDALTLTRLKELQTALAKAVEELPEKERMIISLYYGDELTMKEAGQVLDVSESRVSQIHSQAVARLRKKLQREGLLGD